MPAKAIRLLLFIALSLTTLIASFVLWLRDPSIADENGLMENMQLLSLLLAILFVLMGFIREKSRKSLLIFLLLFYFTLFLRELDLRDLPLPQFVIVLSTKGRDVGLTLGWLLFIFSLIKIPLSVIKEYLLLLKKEPGIYFMVGFLLYGLAFVIDKELFGLIMDMNQLIEEMMECVGVLSFILSASFFRRGDITSHRGCALDLFR